MSSVLALLLLLPVAGVTASIREVEGERDRFLTARGVWATVLDVPGSALTSACGRVLLSVWFSCLMGGALPRTEGMWKIGASTSFLWLGVVEELEFG